MKKLNLGCGTDIREGYVNLDIAKLPGVDIVWNLDKTPWPFKDGAFDEICALSNILGFVKDFKLAMSEIWRISKPNALVVVSSPLFPSINCFSDPHTKKVFTYNSFVYFEPGNKFNYYSDIRFKTTERKIIFSMNKYLKFLNPLVNLSPKFYTRFFANLLPSNGIIFKLRAVKNER